MHLSCSSSTDYSVDKQSTGYITLHAVSKAMVSGAGLSTFLKQKRAHCYLEFTVGSVFPACRPLFLTFLCVFEFFEI